MRSQCVRICSRSRVRVFLSAPRFRLHGGVVFTLSGHNDSPWSLRDHELRQQSHSHGNNAVGYGD